MSMSATVVWKTPPDSLAKEVFRYGRLVLEGLWSLMDLFAARAEALAKQIAPWNDQTGAARQGLRGFSQASATGATLYLVHSVFYGIYLEMGTSKMGPYPTISPTLEQLYGPLMAAVRALVGR
jgi:hypothetical protein